MPVQAAQAVAYVAAVITSVAAVVAFKELVYESHIAPKIERWAENFLAKRRARRRQLAEAAATASASGMEMQNVGQCGVGGGANTATTNLSTSREQARSALNADTASFELENPVAKEPVAEWSSQVDCSQTPLWQRKTSKSSIAKSDVSLDPVAPTHTTLSDSTPSAPPSPSLTGYQSHAQKKTSKSTLTQSGESLNQVASRNVIFDDPSPSTPTSSSLTGCDSPGPSFNMMQLRQNYANQSFRGPLRSPPAFELTRLPTPAPSSLGTSSPDLGNASLELAPSAQGAHNLVGITASGSARSESPFSDFSQSSAHRHLLSQPLSFVVPTVTSPFGDPGEGLMMDMDFLSASEEDMDELLARSPAMSHMSITESELDGSESSS